MKKVKLAFIAAAAIFCFACGNKTEADFSMVPIKGANGEYQYIDISQKGKIVINPQFERAHIFRGGLALVKTSGAEGKWGYIDKKGKFAIAPVYVKAQDFGDGVAWVQLENQPPMLIDNKGKTILQMDSLIAAYPFSNGVAGINVYSQRRILTKFIDKNGNPAAVTAMGEKAVPLLKDELYIFQNKESEKWGYKNKSGEIAINPQFDYIDFFLDGMAAVLSGSKWGTVDKNGSITINPQYDSLLYDGNGLFAVKVGKKWGWVDKKGEIIINPQFDLIMGFNGSKFSAVQMGKKWGYIDREGQITINPQFNMALPFSGNYAMVVNTDGKAGFVDKTGNFAVPPLYDIEENDVYEYVLAVGQNLYGSPLQYFTRYMAPSAPYYQNGDFYMYERLIEKREEERERTIAAASGSITDSRDNKTYKTIKIGEQTWMAENLNYIGDGYLGLCYGDRPREQIRKPENCDIYGRLYDWSEAMNFPSKCNSALSVSDEECTIALPHKGICPEGWHIPTNSDWNKLYQYVDQMDNVDNPNYYSFSEKEEKKTEKPRKKQGTGEKPRGVLKMLEAKSVHSSNTKGTAQMLTPKENYSSHIAGKYLKATSGWNDYGGKSGNGTDDFGFSALPGGYGYSDGYFNSAGNYGYWWSASEYYSDYAYYRGMFYVSEDANWYGNGKSLLFSVRCVQD